MTNEGDRSRLRAAEVWFDDHGLPWFVESQRERFARSTSVPRLRRVGASTAAVGVLAGLVVGLVAGGTASGVLAALVAAGAVLGGYALVALRAGAIARWAVRRTLAEIGLLIPLVTRALPLLLLFTTFLFINAEVWQVAASMPRDVMAVAVLLFAALAVGFLLARLPEELTRVGQDVARSGPDGLEAACRDTPMAADAAAVGGSGDVVPLSRIQRVNLVVVLLVVQASQVLLLSVAVYGFFVVFGLVAISDDVVASWIGSDPVRFVPGLGVSTELVRVSTFLAAFSGLYFTVYAVTDSIYREQFFGRVIHELERAVAVRAVYLALRSGDPTGTSTDGSR